MVTVISLGGSLLVAGIELIVPVQANATQPSIPEPSATVFSSNLASIHTLTSTETKLTPFRESASTSVIANSASIAPSATELPQISAPTSDLSVVDYDTSANPGMAQVTSVSQLTDVQPTDWAVQALQTLVERYGCISGYPDGTFRGNRSLTRFEFAAGMAACLDRINELAATTGLVTQADLLTLQKLQESFATELATLRGRVDKLEAETATLEEQQFSTTTKLTGLAWMNLTGAFTSDDVKLEALPNTPAIARFAGGRDLAGNPLVQVERDAEPTLSSLAWLTFNTSFTGQDLLSIQLAAGNGFSPINQFVSAGFANTFGTPYTDQTSGPVTGQTDVVIQDFFYSFPVGDTVKLTVGPRINWFSYFDFNRFTYFLTGASSYAAVSSTQSNAAFWGSGAVLEWNFNPQLRFAASYLGENIPYLLSEFGYNTASNSDFGLFGGTYTATTELTYSPSDNLSLRLRYNYSRLQGYGGQVGGANYAPLPYGYLDAGPGFSVYDPLTGTISSGGLDYAYAHTFALNFDWLINPKFGVFGRYSYGNTHLQPIDAAVNTQSFQAGLGFPDLGKSGALGVLTFVVPMDIVKGCKYFVAGGGDGGTMLELEASYYYPLTDNLAIAPSFYAIFNPNNFDSNPNIYVGNLRAQFSF